MADRRDASVGNREVGRVPWRASAIDDAPAVNHHIVRRRRGGARIPLRRGDGGVEQSPRRGRYKKGDSMERATPNEALRLTKTGGGETRI